MAKGVSHNVVGAVSIRVSPDTTGFADKTKEEVERQLDRKMETRNGNPRVSAKVGVDEKYLRASLADSIAAINDDLAERVATIRIHPEIEITKSNLRKQLSRLNDQIARQTTETPARIHAMVDAETIHQDLSEIEGPLHVKVDTESIREDILDSVSEAEKDVRKRANLRIAPEIVSDAAIRKWRDEIRRLDEQTKKAGKTLRDLTSNERALSDAILRSNREIENRADLTEKTHNRITELSGDIERATAAEAKAYQEMIDHARKWAKTINSLRGGAKNQSIARRAAESRVLADAWERASNELKGYIIAQRKAQSGYDGLLRSVKAEHGHLNALQQKLQQISTERLKVKVEADIDTSSMWDNWRSQYRDKLNDDLGKIAEQVDEFNPFTRGKKKKFTNFMRLDIDRDSLARFREQIQAVKREAEANGIEIDATLDNTSARLTQLELAYLTRDRIVKIKPVLAFSAAALTRGAGKGLDFGMMAFGRMSGLNLMKEMTIDLVRIVPDLDQKIPMLARNLGLLNMALGGITYAGSAAIVTLADLTKMASLAFLGPAFAGGFAFQVGVIVRAFKDLKKQIPEVHKGFVELGDIMSDSFWSTAAKPITKAFKSIEGVLRTGVKSASAATGELVAALAKGLTFDGGKNIEKFFKRLTSASKGAIPAFEALGRTLSRTLDIGSRYFERFSKFMTKSLVGLDDWIAKNDKAGNVDRWIDDGIEAMVLFGRAIKATGGVLSALTNAMRTAGIPGLKEMTEGLERLQKAMSSDRGQTIMSQSIESLIKPIEEFKKRSSRLLPAIEAIWMQLMSGIARLSEPVAEAVTSIFEGLASPESRRKLQSFFDGFGNFISDITPGLKAMASEFTNMLESVGIAADAWGEPINTLLEAFSGISDNLHPGLNKFIKEIAPEVDRILRDLKQPALDVATAMSDLLGDPGVHKAVKDVLKATGDIIKWLLEKIEEFMPTLRDWVDKWNALNDATNGLPGKITAVALAIGALAALGGGSSAAGLSTLLTLLQGIGLAVGGAGAVFGIAKRIGRIGMQLGLHFAGRGKGGKGGKGGGKGPWGWLGRAGKGAAKLGGRLLPGLGWALTAAEVAKALPQPHTLAGPILKWTEDVFGMPLPSKPMQNFSKRISERWGTSLWDGIKYVFRPGPLKNGYEEGKLLVEDFKKLAVDGVKDALRRKGFGEAISGALQKEGIKKGSIDLGKIFDAAKAKATGNNFASAMFSGLTKGSQQVTTVGQAVTSALSTVGFKAIDTTKRTATGVAAAGNAGMAAMGGGVAASLGTMSNIAADTGSRIASGLGSGLTLASTVGSAAMSALANNGSTALQSLQSRGSTAIGGLGNAVAAGMGLLPPIGTTTANALANGFLGGISGVSTGASIVAGNTSAALAAGLGALPPIGSTAASALTTGFLGGISGVTLGASAMAGSTSAAIATGFGALPSIGTTTANALTNGFLGGISGVSAGASVVAGNTGAALAGGLGAAVPAVSATAGSIASAVGAGLAGMTPSAQVAIGSVASAVGSGLAGMRATAGRESSGMASDVGARLGSMKSLASGTLGGMASSVGSHFANMRGKASSESSLMASLATTAFSRISAQSTVRMSSMASSIGKSMSRMRSGTSSAMSGMATTVGRAFSGMRSSAATSTSGLASSVGSAMSRAASSVRISGLNASRSYVSSMSSLRSGAIGQATGAALGVQRRLRFSASGAGSYVGSTYRSGLSGSTLGAIGVAAGAALSVRARLSINAHSSGASIGSTFANGIRSRIGAVMAAASALAGAARRMLPNSPAKDGPFSGSGWGGWGESIAEELARGIRNGASEVTREAAYMMNGVASEMGRTFETGVNVNARASRYTPLYGGGAQAPAGASNVTVNVTSNSDEPLREGARFAKDVAFQLKGLSI